MQQWPNADQQAVYIPPARAAEPESEAEIRARMAVARIREELPVSDEILSQIIAAGSRSGSGAPSMFTGQHDRYRQLLSEVIEPDRLVIDRVRMTKAQLRGHERDVRAQVEQLAEQGIFITRHAVGIDGLGTSYLAADHEQGERVLRDRFGEFATIRYAGASNYSFRPLPFGSWLASEDRLHLFYGLPHNRERAGGGQVFETERAVIVALTILDWRGAKTLIGGFIASHAAVQLRAPLGDRVVIDDSENRARPHWTHA